MSDFPQKIAVGYARYSSDEQREESIDAQIRYIKEYCEKKDYLLLDVYIDEAKSATSTKKRYDFMRMIDDSKTKKFNTVIVHKQNRFARDRFDSAFYKRELKLNGVKFESVTELLDDSPESVILESLLEGMAEYFSKDLAREVRKGLIENALKAQHTGGRPPYGYKVNPETRHLEIDEEKAPAVRLYFELLKKRYSNQKIANILNELGYRTQQNRLFKGSSFHSWAGNVKYKGIYTWDVHQEKDERGKRSTSRKKPVESQIIIPGAIPAIISPELWDEVNEMFKHRKTGPGSMKAKTTYLLSGKIKCGNCGYYFNGATSLNKKSPNQLRYNYYECKARCGNKRIPKAQLEGLVLKRISEEVLNEKAMARILRLAKEKYLSQHKEDANKEQPIIKQITELDTKIGNWIEALGMGVKSVADKIKEAEEKKQQLETELFRIRAMKKKPTLNEKVFKNYLNQQKGLLLSNDDEDRKQAVQELVNSVTISYDKPSDTLDVDISFFVF